MNGHGALSFCVRDPLLWFYDGSVVLKADDTLFRVYSGLLAQLSPVFRDMFAFPQPCAGDDETYEGCPVVHMPDAADELQPFLRAMHDLR